MTSVHPDAQVRPAPRFSLVWIVPLLSVGLAAVLAWQSWGEAGPVITVRFTEGHGLKPGDTLRHRGIVVGRVDSVRLAEGGAGIEMEAVLDVDAETLAKVGSRFWIVRPELGLDTVAGLDTLIGDRYVGLLPGGGASQRVFDGLDAAPIADALGPGLDVTLEGQTRGSLRPGSPVTYRGIQVGSVLSVGLASDARTVEVGVRIREGFTALIQPGTHFWDSGGLDLDVGLTGVRLRLETLQQLARGGITLAVPEAPAATVSTGHRFTLHPEADDAWLRWRPSVAIGHSLLPPGAPLPQPERAALIFTAGRIFKGEERREGWALRVDGAWLLPDNLVTPDEGAHEGSARLEVAEQRLDPASVTARPALGLALVPVTSAEGPRPWTRDRQRQPLQPEDALAVGDPSAPPLSLAAGRFELTDSGWAVDPALPLDSRWHGAVVLARSDGRLLGMLLVDDDEGRVVPLPSPLP